VVEGEARLVLVGASDEYLLQEALEERIRAAEELLGDAALLDMGTDVKPERLAQEVVSGSLFDPRRILLVRDIGSWLQAPAPVGGFRDGRTPNPAPLVSSLQAGVPEDVVLLMGAWCGAKPRGPLVDLVGDRGVFQWIPLPARPKPWEDALISGEEAATLRRILRKNQPELQLSREAEELLFARLGFAPRQLIAEAGKLAAAAGPRGSVDEELVRQLCFPRVRSLDAVRDAILKRDAAPLIDLMEAMESGIPVRDWQGRPVDASGVVFLTVRLVVTLVTDLLVIRRVFARQGRLDELEPKKTGGRSWYSRRFKSSLGPWLQKELGGETWGGRRKRPSIWNLSELVKGASLYRDEELIAAVAGSGALEEDLRSGGAVEALSAWLLGLVASPSSP